MPRFSLAPEITALSMPAVDQAPTGIPGVSPVAGKHSQAMLLPVVFSICAAACLLLISQESFTDLPPLFIVWTTAAVLFLLARWQVQATRAAGDNPWTAGPPLVLSYYFFRFGWGALVVYYWELFPWEVFPHLKWKFYNYGARQNLETACQLILLGGLGLFLGSNLPVRSVVRLLPDIRWPVSSSTFRRNVAWYIPGAIAVQFCARLLPLSVQFIASLFGTVVYVLLIIAGYWLFSSESGQERLKWILIICGACGIGLFVGFVSGQVGEVLAPMVMVGCGYLLAKQAVPWKMALATGGAAFFLAFPFLTMYKLAGQRMPGTSITSRMDLAGSQLQFFQYRGAVELTMERFIARLAEAEFPAIFVGYYPSVYPFQNGHTLAIELTSLVPRVLWPGKPVMSDELNRYSAEVGLLKPGDGTAATFDVVSEYYLNWGRAGVFWLSMLHGYYVAALYGWLHWRLAPVIAGSLSVVLFLIVNSEFYGIGQMFVSHVKILPVWILLLYILSRRRPESGEPTAFQAAARGFGSHSKP
jgi:hypothetical protein